MTEIEWWEYDDAAEMAAAIAGGARTPDLGGTLSTDAMTQAVLARLQ